MEDEKLYCVYCGNPRPEVSTNVQSKKSTVFSLPKILTHQRESIQNLQCTPSISCKLCGRGYLLFATLSESGFISNFLRNFVMYTDDVIDGLNYYDIGLEDLSEHVIGITQPLGSKKEVHIVLNNPNGRYYIRCVKERGGYLAINIERVVIL